MKGIYKYTDLENGEAVYVGKDSHIDKNERHKAHLRPSMYDEQHINKVLQNNSNRYEYSILYCSDDVSEDDLNMLEMSFIERYNPRFNFTKGGEGISGFKHSDETKKKISEANKGKKRSKEFKQKLREINTGKKHSDETKKKISESHKGKNNPNYGRTGEKHPMYGKHHTDEARRKISDGNKYKYATISKSGFKGNKQRYALRFNGKYLKYSINLDKLLNWFSENYPREILKIPKKEDL